MDFYSEIGKVALGSRLRRLSDRFTEDAAKVYPLYQVDLDPKWFPVFYVLSRHSEASVTEIAQIIGHSHPSVSQIVKEMSRDGIVSVSKGKDARVSMVSLSEAGKLLAPRLEQQCEDVAQAVETLLSETQHNLWQAIEEVEILLSEKSFFDRVKATRRAREQQQVEIIDYSPEFQEDFKRLNVEWIERYFQMEEADERSLNHPDDKILQPGGHIYLARYQGEIVGTCALIKMKDDTYELAKMAVTETAQGKGIGWLLGQAAISKAKALGATSLYLGSNTTLKPALNLYQKLGFRRVAKQPSPYERCNIDMELKLAESPL